MVAGDVPEARHHGVGSLHAGGQGFLAAFDGFRTVGDARAIAAGIVAAMLPGLTPNP